MQPSQLGGALRHSLWSYGLAATTAVLVGSVPAVVHPPEAHADNQRLNNGVFANIFTAQKQNGCQTDPHRDRRLIEAARVHTLDVLNHHDLDGDIGSDGSNPQDRAQAAGFIGKASETVATNPAIAINGLQVLNQWWYDPPSRAAMQDCRNTAIGVWSENSLDRSVVVAVYGQPA